MIRMPEYSNSVKQVPLSRNGIKDHDVWQRDRPMRVQVSTQALALMLSFLNAAFGSLERPASPALPFVSANSSFAPGANSSHNPSNRGLHRCA